MSHTPGPWRVVSGSRQKNVVDGAEQIVAMVSTFDTGADARLIAAAPELLDRLKSALRVIERANPQMDPEDVTAYTAAAILIAKVEGRTP